MGIINSDSLEISEEDYLHETYRQLKLDTNELLVGQDIKQLTFQESKAFYSEYHTRINEMTYLIKSMTFKSGGKIYDVTLKIPEVDAERYNEIFQTILYNMKINGRYYFSRDQEIVSFVNVEISSL